MVFKYISKQSLTIILLILNNTFKASFIFQEIPSNDVILKPQYMLFSKPYLQ